MESYSSQVKILFRFSNAKWVLLFYHDFKQCHMLMTTLCKETNACWNKHYEAFCNALEFTRKSLVYDAPFNKRISDYLLENNRFKQFKLIVKVSDEKSIEDLIEFISLVKQKSMLKFKKIECTNSKLEVKSYNMLCDYFIEKDFLDIHKLKFQNSDFIESELSKLLDVKFINFVDESINLKLFQSCHIFRIERSDRELIEIINGISIPIHTLCFSIKSIPCSNDKMDLHPTKALQESVKRLTLTDVEINKIWKLKTILPIFCDKFNKLESLKLLSSFANVGFLSKVVEYMNKKIFGRLSIDQIDVGKKNEDSCTIIKHYPRIFCFDRNKEISRVIKAKKMILQFGSGKGLIYSNNDVLIFGYFTYLKLKGIMFDQDEHSYLKQFENSFPKKGKLLENKDEFMAILNNDIDYICIKFKRNCYFPKINCNLIKFVISVDAKDITIRKFQEIAESLNPETKVVVKIFGNW